MKYFFLKFLTGDLIFSLYHLLDDGKPCESTATSEGSKDISEAEKDPPLNKDDVKTPNSVIPDKSEDKSKEERSSFSNSIFSSAKSSASTASANFSFATSGTNAQGQSKFCFGSPSSSNATGSTPTFSFGTGGTTSPSAGFSFGTGKPFTFANVANPTTEEQRDDEDGEDDAPPKPDHKPVHEEGATYTKRYSYHFHVVISLFSIILQLGLGGCGIS